MQVDAYQSIEETRIAHHEYMKIVGYVENEKVSRAERAGSTQHFVPSINRQLGEFQVRLELRRGG